LVLATAFVPPEGKSLVDTLTGPWALTARRNAKKGGLSKTPDLGAAVFMMSLATIWLKTGLMPRWLVGLSYFAAVAVLLASDLSMWVTMTFPVWVLVVSGLLLVRAGLFEQLRAGDH
jgi:hypothetical protein